MVHGYGGKFAAYYGESLFWCGECCFRMASRDYRVAGDFSGGRIAAEGAIDMPTIRETVKTVMEGGDKAFKLRLEKYGF